MFSSTPSLRQPLVALVPVFVRTPLAQDIEPVGNFNAAAQRTTRLNLVLGSAHFHALGRRPGFVEQGETMMAPVLVVAVIFAALLPRIVGLAHPGVQLHAVDDLLPMWR